MSNEEANSSEKLSSERHFTDADQLHDIVTSYLKVNNYKLYL